ncbi:MAG TPA: DUF2959 family protein, partial [Planctomycetota bacterium]|nr:DUF2959 family protein [Planctomycetota bacterium]
NPRRLARVAVAILPMLLAGCSVFGSSPRGPDQVRDLMASIERVAAETEVGRQRTQAAVQALQKFAAANFGNNALAAYGELEQAVKSSEQHEQTLRASLQPMQSSADTLFKAWAADLESYASPELRQCSRERLTSTRERMQTITRTASTALGAYAEINRRLHDHVLFFGHDLNADALAAIQSQVRAMTGMAADLDRKLGECRAAARAYVDAAALPAGAPGTPAAPAGESAATDKAKKGNPRGN